MASAHLFAAANNWVNHLTSCLGKIGLAPFIGDNLGAVGFSPALAVYADEVIAQARRFARGFDMYRTDSERLEDFLPAVKRWLGRHRRLPFLLFLQFYNCHRPYTPPPERVTPFLSPGSTAPVGGVEGFCSMAESTGEPPSQQLLDTVIAHYDGEISFADELLGEVIKVLADTGLGEHTVVVFLSDHGDNLGDHGHIQKWMMYDTIMRMPAIVWAPGNLPTGLRVDELLQQMDLVPMIFELAGLKPSPIGSAISALPITMGKDRGREVVFAEHSAKRFQADPFAQSVDPSRCFRESCLSRFQSPDGRRAGNRSRFHKKRK